MPYETTLRKENLRSLPTISFKIRDHLRQVLLRCLEDLLAYKCSFFLGKKLIIFVAFVFPNLNKMSTILEIFNF